MDIKNRITQLMDERGWSEDRLAKEANLSIATIRNCLNKNSITKIKTLDMICYAFGITKVQFFCEGSYLIDATHEDKELFEKWDKLNEEQKSAMLKLMETMR